MTHIFSMTIFQELMVTLIQQKLTSKRLVDFPQKKTKSCFHLKPNLKLS